MCPWEIELAPEEYQPKDEDYRPFGAAGGGGGAEEERSQADQAKVDAGQAIAERLGWPQGTAAAPSGVQHVAPGGEPRRDPARDRRRSLPRRARSVRVLVEVMCLGGYELAAEENGGNRWRARWARISPRKPPPVSRSRNTAERYLLEFEMWLWDNADTLGPGPEEFSLPTPAATPVKQPLTFTARVQPAMDTMDEEGEEDEERVSPEDGDSDFRDDDDDDDTGRRGAGGGGGLRSGRGERRGRGGRRERRGFRDSSHQREQGEETREGGERLGRGLRVRGIRRMDVCEIFHRLFAV